MKLRNKKTGEIGELSGVNRMVVYEPNMPLCGNSILGEYDTLAELNEEWEDYTPAEPLIKDEKIRKVVRLWADVNGDTRVYYNRPTIEICINDKAGYVIRSIKFKSEYREAIDIESGYYTITELCGEGE